MTVTKQSMRLLCALGFLNFGLLMETGFAGPKTGTGKVLPTVKAGAGEQSGQVQKPYGVVKKNQGSQESTSGWKRPGCHRTVVNGHVSYVC